MVGHLRLGFAPGIRETFAVILPRRPGSCTLREKGSSHGALLRVRAVSTVGQTRPGSRSLAGARPSQPDITAAEARLHVFWATFPQGG